MEMTHKKSERNKSDPKQVSKLKGFEGHSKQTQQRHPRCERTQGLDSNAYWKEYAKRQKRRKDEITGKRQKLHIQKRCETCFLKKDGKVTAGCKSEAKMPRDSKIDGESTGEKMKKFTVKQSRN